MKRILVATCTGLLAFTLAGCSAPSDAGSDADNSAKQVQQADPIALDAETTVGSLSVMAPSSWSKVSAESGFYLYPDCGGLVYIRSEDISADTARSYRGDLAGVLFNQYIDGIKNASDGEYTIGLYDVVNTDEADTAVAKLDTVIDGDPYTGKLFLALADDGMYSIMAALPPDADAASFSALDSMIGSAKIEASHNEESSTAYQQPVIESAANPTMSQSSALKMAESYLDLTAFSYSGLIDQLEFEGFSTEDATYAADNCGADWNEQAALKAQSYLEISAFSHSGLVEQLVFEGFTQEQAEYGVSSTGL